LVPLLGMPRWEPKARERLVTAAMELFEARGFDDTAVSDIAKRAGLTERTFFNCFPDKREVLFHGAQELEAFLVERVVAAPESAVAMDVVAAALDAIARASDEKPGFADFARRRQALIALHAELRERELTKLASLASAMAAALQRRGFASSEATLAAEVGMAVFRVAFERRASDPKRKALAHHLRAAMGELAALRVTSSAPRSKPIGRRAIPRAR
jgi:AcrR family transcriptional regulator